MPSFYVPFTHRRRLFHLGPLLRTERHPLADQNVQHHATTPHVAGLPVPHPHVQPVQSCTPVFKQNKQDQTEPDRTRKDQTGPETGNN